MNIGRTLRDTSTTKTDKAIQQFNDAFTVLKNRFCDRLNVDSWKMASTVRDGVVQLVATADRLKEIGKP